MRLNSKIYVAGHNGMAGSALIRLLEKRGYTNIIYASSSELDLRDQKRVFDFFDSHKPEFVFLAAAKVGGIYANDVYRGDFLYDNLMIQNNVIKAAHIFKVAKLLFLGSSCIYPKVVEQPINERSLLTGPLEPTNEPYAIAKIAGLKLCENFNRQYGCNFISAMPTNLYGPNDNYDLENSHVLPALLRKFITAVKNDLQEVTIWGTGSPMREFMHVDDFARACLLLMENYDGFEPINIGVGQDITIRELAILIGQIVGYKGKLVFDETKPDGTLRKLLDVTKLDSLGFKSEISLEVGIRNLLPEIRKMPWYL